VSVYLADDNAGTLLAIESIKQLKARYVTAIAHSQELHECVT
jgi:hypothetical protein